VVQRENKRREKTRRGNRRKLEMYRVNEGQAEKGTCLFVEKGEEGKRNDYYFAFKGETTERR